MNLDSIINLINREIKLKTQESWDNSGLQIGSKMVDINKIMLTLDLDLELAEYALKEKVDLIITHHPLFFSSIKTIDFDSHEGKMIKTLVAHEINLYSLHTSYDMAEGGVNFELAEKLNIRDYQVLHPINIDKTGYGGIGYIPPINVIDYARYVKEALKADYVRLYCKDDKKMVKRVAFCGGSGSEFIEDAINLKADLYITGDIKYHQAQEALKYDLAILDAGHYNTEAHSLDSLKNILEKAGLEVILLKKNITRERII